MQAVRSGPWKLYLPLANKFVRLDDRSGVNAPMELFNLVTDVAETRDVSAEHPDVVTRLIAMAEHMRADLGDHQRQGIHQRPAGWMDDPKPCVLHA